MRFPDATPLRNITLNPIPCVPKDEPLLRILDKFQEGHSHMAIVSRFSNEKAESVRREVKKGLTQRLKDRVGMGDSGSDASSSSSSSSGDSDSDSDADHETADGARHGEESNASEHDATSKVSKKRRRRWGRKEKKKKKEEDVEMGRMKKVEKENALPASPLTGLAMMMNSGREQQIPDDAVLAEEGADEVRKLPSSIRPTRQLLLNWHLPDEQILRSLDPAVMPLGIITLEDVVEGTVSSIHTSLDMSPHPFSFYFRAHWRGDIRRIRRRRQLASLLTSFSRRQASSRETPWWHRGWRRKWRRDSHIDDDGRHSDGSLIPTTRNPRRRLGIQPRDPPLPVRACGSDVLCAEYTKPGPGKKPNEAWEGENAPDK